MEWSQQKLHSWLHGTKYVMRSNKWSIWAGREMGKLYYDCYRGHVKLGTVDNADDAKALCLQDKEKHDASLNSKDRREDQDRR